MYRLNCQLPDERGNRLSDYSARTGIAKVAIVTQALDQYLKEQEARDRLVDQLSDPEIMGKVCKALGFDLPLR